MPTRMSPSTRARDADRTHAAATLDEAHADGQLSDDEYSARIDFALEAETLADLHALIEDLQGESRLTPMSAPLEPAHPVRTARASRTGFLAVAVPAMAVVVALGFGIRACAADNHPVSTYGDMGYQNPAVVAEIARAVSAKTGTTVVDSLTLQPDLAVVAMPAPGLPQKQVRYYYRSGELGDYDDSFSSSRDADQTQIDLTDLDLPTISGVVAGAAQSLNLSRIDSMSIQFRGNEDGPDVSISAENTDEERGSMNVDPSGEFLSVRPFGFGK